MSFLVSVFDNLLSTRRVRKPASKCGRRTSPNQFLDFTTDLSDIDSHCPEHVTSGARWFRDQPQQYVLGADVFMIEASSFVGR